MTWRGTLAEARRRTLDQLDPAGVDEYEALVGAMSNAEQAAHLTDLRGVFTFEAGMRVLDAGAGTGTICSLLQRLGELEITALEPAPSMLERLRRKTELAEIETVMGFCDGPEDRGHFDAGRFDVVVSRQLTNGLFDPLTAFANWHHWLAPDGAVVVMDGLYDRGSWQGDWAREVDVLPLSACQSMAMVPYLLERSGFGVETVSRMAAVDALPTARTPRYVVVARKAA